MLKFYIVDDDLSIIKVLENIIEDEELGSVIGYSLNGEDGVKEILSFKPDILLVDLLMPHKDGIQLINEIKNKVNTKFIMISQVNAKDMISKAYKSGVEFYINKPINIIEVVSVVKKVIEIINMERKLDTIKNMFDSKKEIKEEASKDNYLKNIKIALNRLGILGEKGGEDILEMCSYLIKNDKSIFEYKVRDICSKLSDNPKAMEQRIRRAINKGLSNLANLGIEDYMNSDFIKYSNSIYDFESIKGEMDYIRGKRKTSGKISVRKFIDSIILHNEME